jgi:YD repeat-containing protein
MTTNVITTKNDKDQVVSETTDTHFRTFNYDENGNCIHIASTKLGLGSDADKD